MNEFTKGCFEAALWSECDENNIFLEDNYEVDDFSLETKNKIISDCASFLDRAKYLIPNDMLGSAGQDFWISRNAHQGGLSFNKNDYKGNAEKLHEIAKAYPAISLVIDSDNKICYV